VICLFVRTDGRLQYIERAIPSALAHLHGPIARKVIFDDSGDDDYFLWLRRFIRDGFTLVRGEGRSGFGGSVRQAWAWLEANTAEPWLFELEDDFVFNRDVDLNRMVRVLSMRPYLAQLVLKRQPWNPQERAVGGIIEQHPGDYVDCCDDAGARWCEHRRFWSTNPCLYRRAVMQAGWPEGDYSEGRFGLGLLESGFGDVAPEDVRFAFWGAKAEPPAVEHIGLERAGCGY
jgi:hypothetical protein